MGKKTKGQDRDKYYHLAKDQGYRARSAFKLIEVREEWCGHVDDAVKPCPLATDRQTSARGKRSQAVVYAVW